MLEFEVDEKPCFEIPLSNVSNCTAGKSEAALEFHQNEDCPISLMEMRLHIPIDPDASDDVDPVEVSQFAHFKTFFALRTFELNFWEPLILIELT